MLSPFRPRVPSWLHVWLTLPQIPLAKLILISGTQNDDETPSYSKIVKVRRLGVVELYYEALTLSSAFAGSSWARLPDCAVPKRPVYARFSSLDPNFPGSLPRMIERRNACVYKLIRTRPISVCPGQLTLTRVCLSEARFQIGSRRSLWSRLRVCGSAIAARRRRRSSCRSAARSRRWPGRMPPANRPARHAGAYTGAPPASRAGRTWRPSTRRCLRWRL